MTSVPTKARPFRAKRLALLVLIALMLVTAATGRLQYRRSIAAAKESVLKTDLSRMREAIHQYFERKGRYPSSLDSLVAEGYLRRIPADPFTRSSVTWTTTRVGRDPSKPSAEPGVHDVRSGARGTARDGSRYSDW